MSDGPPLGLTGIIRDKVIQSAAVFLPDIVTQEQWCDRFRSSGLTPERRLWLAVLEDAIDAITRGSRIAAREAFEWIETPPAPGQFNSFAGICEVLGLSSDYVRRGLEAKYRLRRWSGESAVPKVDEDQILRRVRIASRGQEGVFSAATIGRLPSFERVDADAIARALESLAGAGEIVRAADGYLAAQQERTIDEVLQVFEARGRETVRVTALVLHFRGRRSKAAVERAIWLLRRAGAIRRISPGMYRRVPGVPYAQGSDWRSRGRSALDKSAALGAAGVG